MKKINFNPIDLDPETLGQLSDEQSEEVQGGGSCNIASCWKAQALDEEEEAPAV